VTAAQPVRSSAAARVRGWVDTWPATLPAELREHLVEPLDDYAALAAGYNRLARDWAALKTRGAA